MLPPPIDGGYEGDNEDEQGRKTEEIDKEVEEGDNGTDIHNV